MCVSLLTYLCIATTVSDSTTIDVDGGNGKKSLSPLPTGAFRVNTNDQPDKKRKKKKSKAVAPPEEAKRYSSPEWPDDLRDSLLEEDD